MFPFTLAFLHSLSVLSVQFYVSHRSAGLCEVYISVFNRVRKHLYMPRVFDTSDPPEVFQEMAQVPVRNIWFSSYGLMNIYSDICVVEK